MGGSFSTEICVKNHQVLERSVKFKTIGINYLAVLLLAIRCIIWFQCTSKLYVKILILNYIICTLFQLIILPTYVLLACGHIPHIKIYWNGGCINEHMKWLHKNVWLMRRLYQTGTICFDVRFYEVQRGMKFICEKLWDLLLDVNPVEPRWHMCIKYALCFLFSKVLHHRKCCERNFQCWYENTA